MTALQKTRFIDVFRSLTILSFEITLISGVALVFDEYGYKAIYWHQVHRIASWAFVLIVFGWLATFLSFRRVFEYEIKHPVHALVFQFLAAIWCAWIGLYITFSSGMAILIQSNGIEWGTFWPDILSGQLVRIKPTFTNLNGLIAYMRSLLTESFGTVLHIAILPILLGLCLWYLHRRLNARTCR